MRFVVKFREGKSPTTNRYPRAVLLQDNWDDYGYKSTFQVTLYLSATETPIELGSIKIIQADRTGGYTEMPRRSFERLPVGHASVGGSLDYYETLYKLGQDIFRPYLKGLRDVAFDDEASASVEDTEGYRVSMLRFSGAERTIVDAARLLRAPTLPTRRRSGGFRFKFKTSVARNANSFTVEFDFQRRGRLPSRINALIGYNGTGKTRLLSNLAIVSSGYGYRTKEDLLSSSAGRFVRSVPPFKTVVVVSYSAFDTFVIPGQNEVEKTRLQDEGALFGYVYCGLRERSDDAPDGEQIYRLRTPTEIQAEFLLALRRVRDANRLQELLEVLKPLLRDPSFQRIGLAQLYSNRDDDEIAELFRDLSSGHKFVLKIVTELTAHISGSEPTLVLIDEPETHLHPPLLAAFLKSVRACLDIFDGYAIIATHSPVVLQETPAKYVRVLRRAADQNRVVAPSIETFAENIGVITQEVFNLGDGSTDWHETLKALARRNTLEEIEEMFGLRLGFAARSYVVSVRDEIEE